MQVMLKNLTMQQFIETHNDVLSTLHLQFSQPTVDLVICSQMKSVSYIKKNTKGITDATSTLDYLNFIDERESLAEDYDKLM